MRHRGRYDMGWLTGTKGEPELHYCPPVDRSPERIHPGSVSHELKGPL